MSGPTIEPNEHDKTVRIEIDGTYSPDEARELADEITHVADGLYGPRGSGLW